METNTKLMRNNLFTWLQTNLAGGAKTFLLAAILLCGVTDAWGNNTAKVVAKSSPTGGGFVYVAKDNTYTGTPNKTEDNASVDLDNNQSHDFYLYAQENTGYHWVNWSGDVSGTTMYGQKFNVAVAKSDVEKNVTANFKINTYTVVFNGNGASGGSTEQQGFTYGTAQNLTANGFEKKYTVSFDVDGGSVVSAIPSNAPFNGWATSAGGDVVYSNQQSVNNLTTTHGEKVNLYAKWGSYPPITLPSSTKSGAVLDGWYSGDTKIGNPGATYTPTADITLKAKWQEKYTPEISYKGSTSYNVGDGPIDLQTLWTSTGDGAITYSKVSFIAESGQQSGSTEPAITSNRYLSLNKAGTLKIHLEQAGTLTYYPASADVEITISRIANTLTVDATHSMYVEDVWNSVVSNKNNNDVTVTTTSSDATIAYYDVASNKILAPNSQAKSFTSTNITLHIIQAETYKYTGVDKTITVTVNKYNNTITASYAGSMYLGSTQNVTISSNNTDTPVIPTQTAGNTIATLNAAKTQVTSYAYLGTATWTLSQAETYKYKAANNVTMSINVVQAAVAECYVLNDTQERSLWTINNGPSLAISEIPSELYFEMKYSGGLLAAVNFHPQYSTDGGSNWTDLGRISDESQSYHQCGPYTLPANATHVRFITETGQTNTVYYKNVKVTRKKYVTPTSSITIDKKPTGEPIYVDDEEPVTATLHVDWSFCNGGTLKLSSTNPKFTLSQSSITEATDGTNGSKDITVSYHSATAGTDEGKIVIYNDVYRKEATIIGITQKKVPTMSWWSDDNPITLSTQEDPITNPVIDLTEGCDYTVTASASGYVTIDNEHKTITPVNPTTAGEFITLTATVDNDHYYGQITKQIAVTNLKSQTITWNQSFSNLKVGDAPITLTATAQTTITYQSSDPSVVTVSGNQMTIVGKGTAYVVATAAADAEYAQAMAQKAVIVRNPGESCAPYEATSGTFRSGHDLIMQWDFPATSVSYTITKPTNVGLTREATIQEWYDNAWHTITTFRPSNNGTSDTKSINIKSRAIRVTSNADNDMTVNSLRVDMTQYFNLDKTEMSMAATTTSAITNTFSIDYANIQGPLEYTSDNPYLSFSPATGTMGDCGEWGNATITVTYAPAEVQDGDYTITVWDGKTESLKKTITVHCKATAPVQTMTWNQTFDTPQLTTDLIVFNATTDAVRTEENPYPVVYTTSDASVATIINGNQLNILKPGVVKITASQDGKDGNGRQRYNAVSLDKTITIDKATPTVTFPTTTPITYGTALAQSQLVGGSAKVNYQGVETPLNGSFNWTDVGQFKPAGTQSYQVVWTPGNADLYNSVNGNVSITINKATPTLTVTNPATQKVFLDDTQTPKLDLVSCVTAYSAENDTHGHAQPKSAITYTCTPSTGIVTGDKKFYATAEGTYTITATAPATSCYKDVSKTITVKVEKNDNPIVLKVDGTVVTSTTVDCEGSTTVAVSSKHTDAVYTVSPASSGYISASVSGSNVTINAAAGSSNKTATFTVSQAATTQYKAGSATITVNVKPIFRFAAVANVGPVKQGTVSASVAETSKIENYQTTSSSTTATFSATPNSGYHFDGWYTSSDCTGSAESTANPYEPTITNTSAGSTTTKTLYAKFTAKQHTLSWFTDGDPLTGNYTQGSVDFGTPIIQPNTPTKSGYTFAGWNAIVPATMPDNDLSFTATWTANSYTVTLNRDGGTGGSASVMATYAAPMPSASAPSRTGYTFQGYYDQQNGAGTKYYNNDMSSAKNWNKTAATTLYAYWTANTYTVKLYPNGGAFPGEEGGQLLIDATYGQPMPAVESKPTRTGLDFVGFYDENGVQYYDENMNSTHLWDKTEPNDGSNITLWAKWSMFQVNYNLNYEGADKTNLFTGWSEPKTLNGVTLNYDPVTSFITLNGTCDHNTSFIIQELPHIKTGDIISFKSTNFSWGGSKMTGWPAFETCDFTGAQASPRQLINIDGNREKKDVKIEEAYQNMAVWVYVGENNTNTFDNMKFKLCVEEGSSFASITSPSGKYVKRGEQYGTLAAPERAGYTFLGWFTEQEGGTQIEPTTFFEGTDDQVLYAHWELTKTYTINFDAQGGSECASKTVIYRSNYGELPTTTRAGYVFAGWYTEGGEQISADTPVPYLGESGASQTLYAHWNGVTVSNATPQTVNFTAQSDTKTATLTFATTLASSKSDFNAPTFQDGAANGWTITDWNYANNQVTVNLSFTATENTTTLGDHVATVVLTAKSNNSATGTVTAHVEMTPVYTCNIGESYKVDDARLDLKSLWTSSSNGAITYSVEQLVSGGVSDAGHKTEVIDNQYLTLGEAGTWKLTLSQTAGTSSKAGTQTKEITISKYATTLSVLLGGAEQPDNTITLYYGDGIFVKPSSNSDALIEGTQIDEGICGTYYHDPVTGTFYAAATPGTAQCRLTQAETYKYAAATLDFYVIVTTKTDGCNALDESGTVKSGKTSDSWFIGSGQSITYTVNKADRWAIEGSVDGNSNWTKIINESSPASGHVFTDAEKKFKYIRIRNFGNLLEGDRTYEIHIVRNRFIEPSVTELSPKKVLLGSSATNTFDVSYSVCPGGAYVDGNVRIQSSNNQEGLFTVTPDNIKTETDATSAGTATISVKYNPDKVGKDTTILAVYTRFDKKRVYVYAETIDKWTPTAHWNYGDGEVVFYKRNGDITPNIYATDDNGDTMAKVQWHFESSNTGVATITGDGKIHPVGVGTTTITAYVVVNDTCYQSQSVTQTIYISDGTVITLNPNGGTGDNTVHVGYGATTLDNTPAMSRIGYTLKGYYTAFTGGTLVVNNAAQLQPNTAYTDGSSHWISKAADNITLYAQWTANQYTVSFDRNGHSTGGTLATRQATYDANMPTLQSTYILKETGSTFLGYWDAPEGGTQYYTETGASARTWDKAADTKLYAHWIGADFFTWPSTHFYANGIVPSNVAQPFSKLDVTYTSSNSAIVSVDADGKTMFAHKAGTVNLTATTAQDPNNYFSVITETKTITIDSCKQTVNFPKFETFYIDETTGKFSADIVLTATVVDSMNAPIAGHHIYYTVVSGSDIATITEEGGVYILHINCTGSGTAQVKAYVLADTVYKYASVTQDVVVKSHAEPCNTTVEDKQRHTLYSLASEFTIKLDGVPYSELSFDVSDWKFSWSATTLKIVGKDIHGNSITYESLSEIKEKGNKLSLRNDTLQSITFSTSSELILQGGFTISNIVVTQSQYIRASIDHIDEKPYVGDYTSMSFTVDYSDKAPIHAVITDHNDMVLTREEVETNDCGDYGTFHYTIVVNTTSLEEDKKMLDTVFITTPAGDRIVIPIQLTFTLDELYQFASGTIGHLTDTLDWENLDNWYLGKTMGVIKHPEHLPTIKNRVQLLNPARINSHVEVYGIERGDYTPDDAKIIIAPTGGLTVYRGDIKGRKDYSNNIIIEANKEHQGYLRISPQGIYSSIAMNVVSQFATKSTLDTGANKDATWQYFGVPGNSNVDFTVDYVTWLYEWSEPQGWLYGWNNMKEPVSLKPFQGYAITQYGQPTYSITAPIFTGNKEIELTYTKSGMKGQNLIANGYLAPIDAKRFTIEDFEVSSSDAMDYTFYIFNSGSWNQWNAQSEAEQSLGNNAPGTYTAIPALGASMLDEVTLIAPMQGIYIQTYTSGNKIKLDYAKHVWYATPSGALDDMNNSPRVPVRASVADEKPVSEEIQADVAREIAIRDSLAEVDRQAVASLRHRVRLNVYGENSGADHLYLLEKDAFTPNYDNGYDAPKMWAENGSAEIYTTEQDGQAFMSVSATNQLEGMYVGFGSSDASYYQLSVTSVIGNSLYLKDLTNDVEIPLAEGQIYHFNQAPGTYDDYRFMVVRHEAEDTPTGDNQVLGNTYIWTDSHNLHIENASASSLANLYAVDGKLLFSEKIAHSAVINIDHLPNSVYLVNVDGKQMKFVKE